MKNEEITKKMEEFLGLQDNVRGDEYGQTDLDHADHWLTFFATFIGVEPPDLCTPPERNQ